MTYAMTGDSTGTKTLLKTYEDVLSFLEDVEEKQCTKYVKYRPVSILSQPLDGKLNNM